MCLLIKDKNRQKSETGNGESEVENTKKKLVTLRYQVCVKKSLVTAGFALLLVFS
jgi:hypothetical protein